MKRVFFRGVVFSSLLVAAPLCTAFAADMAVKAPAPAAASDPWTGAYVGGSVGGMWSNEKWTTVTTFPFLAFPITGPNNPASLDGSGVRAGGYIGYNVKISPLWVAGLEGDLAYTKFTTSVSPFPGTPGGANGGGPTDTDTVKLGWDASIRGRLGYLINPTVLLYGTGGVAWQEITTNSTCAAGGGFCGGAFTSGNASTDKAGWTLGGGIEAALTNHWFARAEYRFSDFGRVTNVLPPAPAAGLTSSISVKTNIADVGLAYKF
jgi:outer membrane immunogenic protein